MQPKSLSECRRALAPRSLVALPGQRAGAGQGRESPCLCRGRQLVAKKSCRCRLSACRQSDQTLEETDRRPDSESPGGDRDQPEEPARHEEEIAGQARRLGPWRRNSGGHARSVPGRLETSPSADETVLGGELSASIPEQTNLTGCAQSRMRGWVWRSRQFHRLVHRVAHAFGAAEGDPANGSGPKLR